MQLAEKLKSLRAERNVSQEKLANYLNVSPQAVSKWENMVSMPDISLLPAIARFFDITVDALLSVEQIDKKARYAEYCARCEPLWRAGRLDACLSEWQRAYREMPRYVPVMEMLLSTYFDLDRVRYQKEIVELAAEIYGSETGSYYRGQAIRLCALTYAANGNREKAEKWADKAFPLMHAQEILYMMLSDDEAELLRNFRYANHWYLRVLYDMFRRFADTDTGTPALRRDMARTIANLYETVCPGGDMGYDMLSALSDLYLHAAMDEIAAERAEQAVRTYLTRAADCANRASQTTAHTLTHPLLYGWETETPPEDRTCAIRILRDALDTDTFAPYRDCAWFRTVRDSLSSI